MADNKPLAGKGINRRKFLTLMGVGGAAVATGAYAYKRSLSSSAKGKIVIIGGGAAGISMAARLCRWMDNAEVVIVDPSDTHYYQPGFTLIGSGVYSPDEVYKKQADCIPSGAKWVKDSVVAVDPDAKKVRTKDNGVLEYDFLVVAPGLELKWDWIEGITRDTLGEGDAHCIYDYEGSIKTWAGIQKFVKNGGRGVYTDTYTKHKCGGAPKKICLLSEHYARKQNLRDKLKFDYFTASKELYDVPYFTPRLEEIYNERNVSISLNTRVTGIDTAAKKVHMLRTEGSGENAKKTAFVEDYDFLHFLPPMGAPDFVKEAGLSVDTGSHAAEGWVMVDKETLVHKKYPNIISLGDVAAVPTSKTSAAIRKQVPVAARNLISIMEGRAPELKYNGYAACPIITDYGHVLLCEFDYKKEPEISFPFNMMLDMSKEQYAAWLLKVYGLKPMYFYGMLNGLA